MKLLFDCSEKSFLELYEPEIHTLDDIFVVEDPVAVNYFLDEFNTSIEELKNLGFKAMKNKITIPKGTKIIIKKMNSDGYNRASANAFGFDFSFCVLPRTDFVEVECKALDPELEKLSVLKGLPKEKDAQTYLGYNIRKLILAFQYYYNTDTTNAINKLKLTVPKKVEEVMKAYERQDQ